MPPKVSVIMSVYNGSRFLSESIKSILYQNFINFEFIIIDDCSKDNTWTVLNFYAGLDCRIKLIRNLDNIGLSKSLNKGIALAKGEYIARMDADDISLPYRFDKQLEYLAQHPDCVALGSEVLLIDAQGWPIGKRGQNTRSEDIKKEFFHGKGGAIIHPTAMIPRWAINKVGGFNSRFRVAQDFDFFIRLSDVGKFANLNDVLLKYRQHFDSITVKNKDVQVSSVKEILNTFYKNQIDRSHNYIIQDKQILTIYERRLNWIHIAIEEGYYPTAFKHIIATIKDDKRFIEACKLSFKILRSIIKRII